MSDSAPPSEREQRLHVILAGYLEAQRQGQAPARDAFLAQHPEFAADLAAFLDDQAALAHLVQAPPAIGETIALEPAAPPTGTRVGYFGDYELLREIARGGMGVVYKARQLSLNRSVALKMILSGQFASAQEVQRFRAEAEAAAGLDHPNILPIYEVGEYQGHQYFSMKLVDGGSLANALERTQRPPLRALVGLLVQVCRAVHFAHQRGILHRDLKPANILLSSGGRMAPNVGTEGGLQPPLADQTPFVTDFGLAKKVEGDSRLTQSGAIVGTPSYMAPEQAAGRKLLTTGTDVYSLGAILYEILTGSPPFKGVTPIETLLQVLEREPARPRSLQPRVDRDLETICLKCLEKDPTRRFGSAEALADDLQRWLDGVPITARPAGVVERAAKWVRRRPAIAALLAAIALTGAAGVAGIAWQWRQAEGARDVAVTAQNEALRQATDARTAWRQEAEAHNEEIKAKNAAIKAEGEQAKARADADRARTDAETQRDARARAFTRAEGLRLSAEADAARFRDPGLALLLAIEGVQRTPSHLTFTSLYGALNDCREAQTLGDGGREEQGWHIFEREVRQARYLPDGRRVLAMAGASLRIYDPLTAKMLWEWPGYNLPLSNAAIDADGRRAILIGEGHAPVQHSDDKIYNYTDRLAYVIDLTTGRELHRLRGATTTLVSAEFSGDGKQIVTASWDGAARLYDAASGKLLQTVKPESNPLLRDFAGDKSLLLARFTPDGKNVLTVTTNDHRFSYSYDDAVTGDEKTPTDPEYDPEARPLGPNGRGYGSASINITAESVLAHLWDPATGKQIASYAQGQIPGTAARTWKPRAADIAPDGESMALALEGIVPVYEVKTGKARWTLTGHEGEVFSVAFSPDSQRIATGGADQTVRVWDATTGKELLRLRGHTSDVRGVAFDPTGKRIVSWSSDGTARVWDSESGIEKATLRGHSGLVAGAHFSPDSKFVVTAGDKTVRVWRLAEAPLPDTPLMGHTDKVTALTFSPDGKLAVTVSADQTARLWDTATGKELRVFGQGRKMGEVRMAQFSADGQRLLTAASYRSVQSGDKITTSAVLVWDVATGKELLALDELDTGALAAFFSPDGSHILTVGDGYYRIKKEPANKETKQVGGVTITIESGSTADSGRIQLWDAAKGTLLTTVPGKKSNGFSSSDFAAPAYSPDGRRLAIWNAIERVPQVLDTASGKVVAELRGPPGYGTVHLLFSPDGGTLLRMSGSSLFLHDAKTGASLARLKGYVNTINQAAFSADGKRLVTASGTRAHVWNLETRTLQATLQGHEAQVTSVAFSPDGSRVLSGSGDLTAALWDAATGKMLALYRGHTRAVEKVAFRPDGQQVATVGGDGSARLWPADLWAVVLPRRPRSLSDEERTRYELPAEGKPKPRWDDTEPKFDTLPNAPLPDPFALPAPVDPNGERQAAAALNAVRELLKKPGADAESRQQLLAIRRNHITTPSAVEAARLLTTLPGPLAALDSAQIPAAERFDGQPKELVAVLGEQARRHWGWIEKVKLSPSGRVVATHAYDSWIRLWDPETLAPRGRIQSDRFWFLAGRDEIAIRDGEGVSFWDVSGPEPKQRSTVTLGKDVHVQIVSPDGRLAAGVGQGWTNLILWDLAATPPTRTTLGKMARRGIGHAAFSADNRWLAAGMQNNTLYLYDLRGDAPREAGMFQFPKDTINHVAFSPDNRRLAAHCNDKVRLWDLSADKIATPTEIKVPKLSGIRFDADGKLVAGVVRQPAQVWDLSGAEPKEVGKVPVNGLSSYNHAVTDDGQRMFSATGCTVRAWERNGDEWRERQPPRGSMDAIYMLAFSPDDRTLYAVDGDDALRLWELGDNGGKEKQVEPNTGSRLLLSADGRRLVTGTYAFSVWDSSGAKLQSLMQPADRQSNGSMRTALNADGRLLVRGGAKPALSVFDLTGPEPRRQAAVEKITGDEDDLAAVSLSPDGRLLATVVRDGSFSDHVVRMWRVTGTELKPLAFPWIQCDQATIGPDGKTLATGHRDGIQLWDLTHPVPKERLKLTGLNNYGGLRFRFSAAGDRIVGWYERKIVIWDTATGKEVARWEWPGAFNAVALANDGRHLAVGNNNGTIYILRLAVSAD